MSDTAPAPAAVLSGFRVVETGVGPVALAGRWLADLGAEVWKIETADGDPSRRWPPFARDDGRSLFFETVNAGKRSVAASPAERRALIASADAWIDDGKGADPTGILAAHPRLVVAMVTPFGLDGPKAGFRGGDLVAQAAGGMLAPNGFPDEAPLQGAGLPAWNAGAVAAATGVLLALLERERSGLGQIVDVSLQEAALASVEHVTALWSDERRIVRRRGALHWTGMFRTARCRDGWVTLSAWGDWTTIREWSGARERLDPAWDDPAERERHAAAILDALARFVAGQPADEIAAEAQRLRLPIAPVRRPDALLHDPQLEARGFFVPVDDGRVRLPGPAFRMSATPLFPRGRAPACGTAGPLPLAGEADRAGATNVAGPTGGSGPGPGAPVLTGIRVLDLTHVVAGPVATRILADHGAEVIRVERRATADRGDRERGLFSNLNRGKRSVILDLSRPQGLDLARRLAARSDVVIDNFSPRVMESWGLDYPRLRELRRDVVAVSMSGFGRTGPRRDWVSFGPTLQALAGCTWLMQAGDGRPAGWGYSWADMAAGTCGALATVAALLHRRRTGEGQRVDLSQLECVASLLGPVLTALATDGARPAPPGNRSQATPDAPHGVYRCRGDDRWVAIAVDGDAEWSRLAQAIGDAWALDPALATAEGRLERAGDLDTRIEAWTGAREAEEATRILQAAGVAAHPVTDGRDLCDRDPHLRARGFRVRVGTASGPASLDGAAARLSRTPARITRPGPRHGADTDRVLASVLGLRGDEIAALRASEAVA